MAYSYERYERQQRRSRGASSHRSPLSYWLPLGLTILTATAGFATWIWKERNSDDRDDADDAHFESSKTRQSGTIRNARFASREQLPDDSSAAINSETSAVRQAELAHDVPTESLVDQESYVDQDSIMTKMSGAIWRTPSPQQLFDGASKRVAAGVAAAGAMMGRGLTAIQESNDDFQDHERWAEPSIEAPVQRSIPSGSSLQSRTRPMPRVAPSQASSKKRIAAIVVSAADSSSVQLGANQSYEIQHASIISHLPQDLDNSAVELVILIYAPHLRASPLQQSTFSQNKLRSGSSAASSYSNISIPAADDDQVLDQGLNEQTLVHGLYESLEASALRMVSHPTQVLPFTTPSGHVQLLRHLSPNLVYIEESLSGVNGAHVSEIESWVGQIIVVVGGEGLVDTETEDEGSTEPLRSGWWKDESRVGLGRAEIVEVTRISEDWIKRIS